MPKVLFCFRGAWRAPIEVLPIEVGRELLRCIVSYGTTSFFETASPIVTAIMRVIAPMIEATNRRYAASVANGKLGGRPPKNDVSIKMLTCSLFADDNLSAKAIAKRMFIGERTVYRYLQWGIDQYLFGPHTLDSYVYEALFKKIKSRNPNDKRLRGFENSGQAYRYQLEQKSISGQAENNLTPM